MELWELVAREEIRELVAQYAHFGDGGRFAEMVALFADDGVLRIDDRPPLEGRNAMLAFLGETKRDQPASPAARYIRHHVTTLRIEVTSPDDATGAAYFFVVTDRGPDHWGRYRDRYVRVGGRWRFAERRVRVDGTAPGSWAAGRRAATR